MLTKAEKESKLLHLQQDDEPCNDWVKSFSVYFRSFAVM